ncbi:hypothetical protein EJ110_NYTH38721 [Nymphaea thermarum]|nr:hypothetical protein EJ110_NYTH38721 [Nymphaea thermarum]
MQGKEDERDRKPVGHKIKPEAQLIIGRPGPITIGPVRHVILSYSAHKALRFAQYLIVGLYLPQVSNVMLYLVVQIRPPFRYNEKEFTMQDHSLTKGFSHGGEFKIYFAFVLDRATSYCIVGLEWVQTRAPCVNRSPMPTLSPFIPSLVLASCWFA